MDKNLYSKLYNSRMLKDNQECETFLQSIDLLAETFCEDDITELCTIFDDKTNDSEIMFSAIHLLETLSSETAFINTINGLLILNQTSPEWTSIIIYRCLNDDFSIQMIKKVYTNLSADVIAQFEEKLKEIKNEDCEKFGKAVDEILLH